MLGETGRVLARRMGRIAALGVAALAAAVIAYAAAGVIGGAIPANRGWTEPGTGVRIFVESNGVHTGLVLPVAAAGIDWRDLLRASDIADPRYAAHRWRSFGWGEREFYLETPTWGDVRPSTVLAAAIGSDETLMHVAYIAEPVPGDAVHAITLRPAEYRRLAAFIRGSFRIERGRRPTHRHGYGASDAFYEGLGRYDAITTCNAWTGDALRHAGVRVGAWTPFPETVLRWFPG